MIFNCLAGGYGEMNHKHHNDLRNRIKELRIEKGYMEKDVADYLNVDISTYRSYEAGTKVPNTNNLQKLRELYKLKAELLGADLPIRVKIKYPEEMLDKLENRLNSLNSFEMIDRNQIKSLHATLKQEFSPLLKVKLEALDVPVLSKRFMEGTEEQTILEVVLDYRAELLIMKYFIIQEKIYNELIRLLCSNPNSQNE